MYAVTGTHSGNEARELLGLIRKRSRPGRQQLAFQAVLAGSFLALAGSNVVAQEGARYAEASPADVVLARTADSGSESVVARSTYWNSQCEPRGVTVTIKQPPASGTASVKEGLNPVVANPRFGTAGKCVGKQVMGKQILYRSNPGFRGSDQIVYESVTDQGQRTSVTVKIEVR